MTRSFPLSPAMLAIALAMVPTIPAFMSMPLLAQQPAPTAPPTGPTTTARTLAAPAQATAAVGVVVRVKEIAVTDAATLVTISASFSGETIFVNLADTDSGTYLQDENGQKFPLRKPPENKWLRIQNNDTMEGRLVFLGRIADASKKVKLVFNEGNDGADTSGPGLALDVSLQ